MNKQIDRLRSYLTVPRIIAVLAALIAFVFIYLLIRDTTATKPTGGYPVHDGITATIFWIGEPADSSNDNISNVPTAWETNAKAQFGGADGPSSRDGNPSDVPRNANGIVTSFRPLENPYYFALPAAEYGDNGLIKDAREKSPWREQSVGDDRSLFKGRWIRITSQGKTVYAQWLDVGPNVEDDYDYVFGDGKQKPKNTFGYKAGIDLSPATAFTLGFKDDKRDVSWQFVDPQNVPDGPWKLYPAINNKTYWSD